MANFGKCDLFIPHKQWADNPHELENYLEIERWGQRLKECGGGCDCYFEIFQSYFDIPSDEWTQIPFSSDFVQGTPSSDGVFVLSADGLIASSDVGVRIFNMIGNPSPAGFALYDNQPGMDMSVAGLGFQRLGVVASLPGGISYDPWWWQNSGVTLFTNTTAFIFELCDCKFSFGC